MGLFLEDFAPAAEAVPPSPGADQSGADYEAGVADGRAQVQAELAAADQVALGEIAQTLSDLEIGYTEAQTAVLQSLKGLFSAITESLLPALSGVAEMEAIHEMLIEAATHDSSQDLRLIVPRSLAAGEELRLPHDCRVRLECDETLSDGQAILVSGTEESFLDVSHALERIEELLRFVTETPERIRSHG